jgi:integrase
LSKDAGIYQVEPGRYRIEVSRGRRGADGKYHKVVRTFRGSLTGARVRRAELVADLARDEYVAPAKETLGVYLITWLERIRPPHGDIKVSTWKSYESHVRVHVLTDPIAERRVGGVTTEDVEGLFRRLLYKDLSAESVAAVRRTLRAALNVHPKLKSNPVNGAKAPRVQRREIRPDELWTHQDARRFLGYNEDIDPDMAALVRLALDSGARLGELLALTWRDVDARSQTVTFCRSVSAKRLPGDENKLRFDTPKNDKTRKVDIGSGTAAALARVRDRQAVEPLADVGQLAFHRPTSQGFHPWRLDVTTHTFQRYATAAGVPATAFHYLRHACASWLLADGMDVVAVSERLGHWSPSLTLTIYAHAIKGRQKALAASMDAALG